MFYIMKQPPFNSIEKQKYISYVCTGEDDQRQASRDKPLLSSVKCCYKKANNPCIVH